MNYAQPEMNFSAISDKKLIALLKERGYAVTKKGNIGIASTVLYESRGAWLALAEDTRKDFERHLHAQIGASIGRTLLENALISIEREDDEQTFGGVIVWRGRCEALVTE